MTKFSGFCAGLALGITLALPAAAQDATAATVLATVNEVEITLGDLIVARDSLPDQYKSLPDDVLFSGLLDQLVQQMEAGALPLDQLLDSYKRGSVLLSFCRGKLQAVEEQVKVLEDGQLKPWAATN